MRLLIALMFAAADPGMHVYRSRAELPKEAAKSLPKDFDFKTEMLVGTVAAGAKTIVLRTPAEVRYDHDDLLVILEQKECPPCSGVQRLDPRGLIASSLPVASATLWRVPRAKGHVYEGVENPMRCEPCTAP